MPCREEEVGVDPLPRAHTDSEARSSLALLALHRKRDTDPANLTSLAERILREAGSCRVSRFEKQPPLQRLPMVGTNRAVACSLALVGA